MVISASRLSRPFASLRGRPPSSGPFGSLRRGARGRSGLATAPPCPHQNALKQTNPGFKKQLRRYATSKSGEKQGKEGVGVWAQPIVARRSPRRAATRPEEARIGAEAVPGPWRPEKGLEALERGPGRPRYPQPLPPSFSSLNPAFLPADPRFAVSQSKSLGIRSAGGANPNEPVPATFPFSLAALAANSTLVRGVCRWVGGGGPVPKGWGSEAPQPNRTEGPRRGTLGTFGRREPGPEGDSDRRDSRQGQQDEGLVVRAAHGLL